GLAKVANALTLLLQFSSIMGVLVWSGVLWRRANVTGAWASAAVLFGAWAFLGPIGMLARQYFPAMDHSGWLGRFGREQYVFELMLCYLPAGVLTMIIVSLLTPPPPWKKVHDLRALLKTPVGQEQKLIDAGVQIVYA